MGVNDFFLTTFVVFLTKKIGKFMHICAFLV
jgi:hypothetical protein